MRVLFLLAAAGLALSAVPAEARGLQTVREQDAAYRAAQRGQGVSFTEIRARIRVPGAHFIGAEFDGRIYRLKFMRGAEVIWIDVDARTGRVIGRQ
jgi:hypothetical protein